MKNIQFKYPNKLKELRKANKFTQKDISTYLEFTGEERIS
jgi:transcriptional regulator with XRE-family HTH domain